MKVSINLTIALLSTITQDAKSHEAAFDQIETQLAINKSLERKIVVLEKKELEYLESSQRQAQLVEEALYERDGAIRREQLLLKEIDGLNQKCVDQPKLYKEKNDLALQTYALSNTQAPFPIHSREAEIRRRGR